MVKNFDHSLVHLIFILLANFAFSMKALLKRIISLLMVSIFLLSSTGIVLAKHICLDNAHKTVSLFEKVSCCDTEDKSCDQPVQQTQVSSSMCCLTEFSYHKVDVISGSAFSDSFLLHFPVALLTITDYLFTNFSVKQDAVSIAPDFSLPHYGKQLLLAIHCLLV